MSDHTQKGRRAHAGGGAGRGSTNELRRPLRTELHSTPPILPVERASEAERSIAPLIVRSCDRPGETTLPTTAIGRLATSPLRRVALVS